MTADPRDADRPTPYVEPRYINPLRFCREDLPLYRDRPLVTDEVALENFDLKCNGGILFMLISRGHAKHVRYFVDQWMRMPTYTAEGYAGRVWTCVDAFIKAEAATQATSKAKGMSAEAMQMGRKFRHQMMAYFMSRASVDFGTFNTTEESRVATVKDSAAMSAMVEPLLGYIPDEPPTSFFTNDEVEGVSRFIASTTGSVEMPEEFGESCQNPTEQLKSLLSDLEKMRRKNSERISEDDDEG